MFVSRLGVHEFREAQFADYRNKLKQNKFRLDYSKFVTYEQRDVIHCMERVASQFSCGKKQVHYTGVLRNNQSVPATASPHH